MMKNWERRTKEYFQSVFKLIEFIIQTTLLDTSRNLIRYYIESSGEMGHANKARFAVSRYTNKDLPSLDDIKSRSRESDLGDLDHLVLKMEYASKKLEEGR